MEIGKSNWKPYAGLDCYPTHLPPPREMCSGQLCQGWLASVSTSQQCDSTHAHSEHYSMEAWDQRVISCPGREFCDPKHMERS